MGQSDSLAERLGLLAKSYEDVYGFSGNIKVVVGEEPVFDGSYGLANRSFGIENKPDTRFSINSISKTFTAAAVLVLVRDKKLDLHQPVSRYLPGLNAEWKDSVTAHHLLTHTSGLPRECSVQPHEELTFTEQVRRIESMDLLYSPGERYEYSNAGVTLLGAILEQVSGEAYANFLEREILQPLGLANTGYYRGREVVPNQAVPYRLSAGGLEFAQRSKHYGDNAGGGLYSTVSDLYTYVTGLEQNKVLPREYTDLLFRSHVQSGKTDFEGYAWSIKYFGNEKIHFAAGSGYGTKSVIIRSPETGDFIGITSNWGNTPILQLLQGLYLTIKGQTVQLPAQDALAKPASVSDQIGTYRFDKEALTKHLGIDRSQLKLQAFEGRLFLDDELMAREDDFLRLTYTNEMQIRFEADQMIIRINGNTIIGERVGR
jgi:CubicO group peptidase (beta-lactamase class C family)